MAQLQLPTSNDTDQAVAALNCLTNLYATPSSKSGSDKLPITSSSRLAESNFTQEKPTTERTILYLAYGSNLSAETFRGNRGIKPLSAVNVQVPLLELAFDLPGVPYKEPCFANTRYRRPFSSDSDHRKDKWHKGLIGVVYEVTPEDYRTIIATEGGGASYQDVIVPCFALPPRSKSVDSIPRGTPFAAHTLFAPSGLGGPVSRPDPSYAQSSARYLKLITDGAEEHELPAEYIAYLYSIRPYTITTYRQSVGRVVLLATWGPVILFLFMLARATADKDGRSPRWLAQIQGFMFRLVWRSYDIILKKTFGDGERTIGDLDDEARIKSAWLEESIHLDT